MRECNLISIVIPAYNEQENVPILAGMLVDLLNRTNDYEVIFVNDGSTDNTLEVLKHLSTQHKQLLYISLSKNFGHQLALKAGIDHARGNAIIMMDADLQHPVEIIPQMIELWKKGVDVVYTQRKSDNKESFIKRRTSKLFYWMMHKLSDVPIESGTADFRLIDKNVAQYIHKNNESFLFLRGYIPWLGFSQQKIEYIPNQRASGNTKYTFSKMLSFAINGITGFSIKPLRFATVLGLVISFLAFVYSIYAVYTYFMNDRVISGWTSLLLSVLFIGGMQLIILGIIGEYIGKMYIQTKNRPVYIIDEHNLSKNDV